MKLGTAGLGKLSHAFDTSRKGLRVGLQGRTHEYWPLIFFLS